MNRAFSTQKRRITANRFQVTLFQYATKTYERGYFSCCPGKYSGVGNA